MKNIVDYLKVFKNIETYKSPGPRNMARGGRIGFFKGKSVVSFAEKIKNLWLSGKTTKQINTDLEFIDDKTSTIDGLIDSMKNSKIKVLDGNKEISISKKELKTRPDIKGTTTGGKLPYAKDLVVSKKIKDAAKAGKETIAEFLKNNPNLNRTSFYDFLKKTKTTWKGKGKGKPPFKKEITNDIIKVENFLKENPTVNLESIATGTGIPLEKIGNIVAAYKKSFLEPRDNFIPDKSLKNFVNKINTNAPIGFEQVLDQLLIKNGINPNKVSKETKNKLTKSRKAVSEFFEGGTNFEHTLPKFLIKYIDDPEKKIELLLTGSRTSPALNQFKRRYDNLLRGAVSEYLGTAKSGVRINLKQYNEKVNKIRQTVKDATGGYEIGYLKFDKAGKATAVLPKDSKSLLKTKDGLGPETSQKLSAFENTKYHNNLVNNYNKNPDSPIFNTLKEYEPDPTKLTLYKDQQKAYEQVNKYLKISKQKFLNFANKNIDNPAVQAIFKSPYGKGAAVTTSLIIPQKLVAADGTETKSLLPETALGTAATAGAYKFRKPLIKAAGKTLSALTGPLPLAGMYAIPGFGMDPKSSIDRSILGAELAFAPSLVKQSAKFRPAIQKLLNFGLSPKMAMRAARIASPIGLASLIAEGTIKSGIESAKEGQRIDAIQNEEDQQMEYENLIKNLRNYAAGGMVGDKSGPPPTGGPMSQGLRSLYNNGRKL